MKTIKKIFIDDVLSLVKNFFALVIVIGICFLPALYAWFNIYSNWDPYGNTGALKLAAVSLDEGFTDEDGVYHNQGDTIIENLHENTAVDWQFVDSAEAAIDGVNNGEYYAAVVIDEKFTYNMYNVLQEEVTRPTLHFYENQKKNPVATKISDTVVQTLQNNINVAFTEVVISEVFSSANNVSEEIQEEGGVDKVLTKLKTLSADLTTYQNAINQIIESDAQLKTSIESAKKDANYVQQQAASGAKKIAKDAKLSANANTTLNGYVDDVSTAIGSINGNLTEIDKSIDHAQATEDATKMAEALKASLIQATYIEEQLYTLPTQVGENTFDTTKTKAEIALDTAILIGTIQGKDVSTLVATQKRLDSMTYKEIQKVCEEGQKNSVQQRSEIQAMDTSVLVAQGSDNLKNALNTLDAGTKNIQDKISNKLTPKINSSMSSLTGTLNDANQLLTDVSGTFGNLVGMFDAINTTVDCADTSLEKTNEAIVYVNGRLIEVINDVEKAGESEKLEVLINALSGDPEVYGKFFSTPVSVETKAVYPIENYGSAVAPFYSTLAFWVGALILTAIIKIKPSKEKYPKATERQLYFGRYALYWVLGQIQAAIIVAGDILLLHVQCLHPWLFLLAGSMIATTFTILIYSLVTTWGDAGKALAVVLVVIQIAGSSGTYPIELLPEFFKKVYIFFPFPYAINAIRECLCGIYELDYLKYLATLLIFIAVSLVIGLLIRVPFEPINHYMEERMEDTEMM